MAAVLTCDASVIVEDQSDQAAKGAWFRPASWQNACEIVVACKPASKLSASRLKLMQSRSGGLFAQAILVLQIEQSILIKQAKR